MQTVGLAVEKVELTTRYDKLEAKRDQVAVNESWTCMAYIRTANLLVIFVVGNVKSFRSISKLKYHCSSADRCSLAVAAAFAL